MGKGSHNGTDESEDLHGEADDHHSRAEESRNPHGRAESSGVAPLNVAGQVESMGLARTGQ
ncbi:hypothetical protein M9458_033064, partial [Cirrhinus mrigala]